MVLLVTQLMPYIDLQDNPEQAVNYVLEHYGLLSLWNFVIYVLFTKILFTIGVAAGATGVVSALPSLSDLGALFGLLLIVWFIYLSWVMMRESASTAYSDGGGTL